MGSHVPPQLALTQVKIQVYMLYILEVKQVGFHPNYFVLQWIRFNTMDCVNMQPHLLKFCHISLLQFQQEVNIEYIHKLSTFVKNINDIY